MDNSELKHLVNDCINGKPVTLRFHYVNTSEHLYINALLVKILAHFDLMFVVHPLETVIHELLSNAYKANLKRIYFSEKHLDVSDPAQFKAGIGEFRAVVYSDLDLYHRKLIEHGYYFDLGIRKQEDGLLFFVTDNSPLSPEESKRINDRFRKAAEYENFLAAYDDFFDESEGAGLGIIMTYFLLKDSGVDPKVFKIESQQGLTVSSVRIPLQLKPVGVINNIKDQIVKEIDLLPAMPAAVTRLISMCDDPETDFEQISRAVKADPALSADVLKLANSAGLGAGHRIDSIKEAVITLGSTELKLMLLAVGAKKILQKRFSAFEQVWGHCRKTACFASVLAGELGRESIAGQVYLGALLHDLGKIVLLSISEEITGKIADIASNRHIRESAIIEEVAIGISHAAIGSMIAKKWDFPENLAFMIARHHTPFSVPSAFLDQVLLTHMADIFWGIAEGHYDYSHIEDGVLEYFGIKDEKTVLRLIDICSAKFDTCPNLRL